MQTQILLCVLALVAVAYSRQHIWGTSEERKAIIEEAKSEAKLNSELREESVKANAAENGPVTAEMLLNRGFKKPSVKAIKQGKARLMMEDIVRRAERKLEELRKKSAATVEEKADVVADELYHKPGVLLQQSEMHEICEFSGCCDENDLLRPRDCRRRPFVFQYRSIDGTCNNIQNPSQGASDTDFDRLVPAAYEDGMGTLRGFIQGLNEATAFNAPNPSARLISSSVVRDKKKPVEEDFTHLVAQFGQFLDHDMDLGPELETECEGCINTEECVPIRVSPADMFFGKETQNEAECLPFRRSVASCDNSPPFTFRPREQINVLTSYIDASMVYGSNSNQENAVREFNAGRLKTDPSTVENGREQLPVDTEGVVACPGRNDCFLCGDVRCNEQISLTVMHTLWVREHNRIAAELLRINSFWDDEKTYQEARKIVGAMIQKIVYFDYLPIVLGQEVFDIVIGPYDRYNRKIDASVPNSFATAAYRYGHSLIRENWALVTSDFSSSSNLNLAEMFFNPPLYTKIGGVGPVARGWADVNSRRMDEFMNIVLTTRLFQTAASPGLDLASLNIQRQRDHGLPVYSVFKRFCEARFPELGEAKFENSITKSLFSQLHGGDSLNSELWIAGLAEERLSGSLLGPTFACIFGITFSKVRDGDRFYFEKRSTFKRRQREEIFKASFSRVICDNTDTEKIQTNAFRSDGTKVDCGSSLIPSINLEEWKEVDCFVPVSAPRTSTVIGMQFDTTTGAVTTTNNQQSGSKRCLPVECPNGSPFLLFIFSDASFGFETLDQDSEATYFGTLEECKNAVPVAVFTAEASTAEEDSANTGMDIEIPEEIMNKISGVVTGAAAQEFSTASLESNRKKIMPEHSDKELQLELQEMLKKLQ